MNESPKVAVSQAWSVLAVVSVGTLLSSMAGSTVNLALPELGRELHVSLEQSRWIVQTLLLSLGVLLLPAGKLSDQWGHRRVYLLGTAVFALASLGCGLSQNLPMLLLLRTLQGVGSAMVMSTSPALLTTSSDARHRGRALGMLGTATYLGLTLGPPLGGWIVDSLGWRWTFYFNVPIGALLIVLGSRFLPRDTVQRRHPFDYRGALALLVGLPMTLIAVSEGRRWGFDTWQTWVSLLAGIGGLATFVWLQRRPAPLLDLSLFRSRLFAGALLAAVANYITLFVPILLLPFYLEEGLHFHPAEAGMIIAVQPLTMALFAAPAGLLSDRIGSRGLATVGMIVMAAGMAGLASLNAASSGSDVCLFLVVVGMGTGSFVSPNSSALMGAAPIRMQGTAGSLLAEARVLGMMLGVALATAIFEAGGGRTGHEWSPTDYQSFRLALAFGAGFALLGALASALRGKRPAAATASTP